MEPAPVRRPAEHRAGTVALLGMYGAGNLGDDLLMACFREALELVAPQILVGLVRPEGPLWVPRPALVFGTPYLGRGLGRRVDQWMRVVRTSNVVVLGGGGVLQDTHSWANVANTVFPAVCAAAVGRPWVGWGIGVGPFRHAGNRALAALAARTATHLTVRDKESSEALCRAGVPGVGVVRDPGWWFRWQGTSRRGACGDAAGHRICIVARSWPGVEAAAIAAGVAPRSDHLRWRECEVVPFEYGRGMRVEEAFCEEIAAALSSRGVRSWVGGIGETPSLTRVVEALAAADCVITMRYHGVVLASLLGIPVVSIACSPKLVAIMNELDSTTCTAPAGAGLVAGLHGALQCAVSPEARRRQRDAGMEVRRYAWAERTRFGKVVETALTERASRPGTRATAVVASALAAGVMLAAAGRFGLQRAGRAARGAVERGLALR